MRLQKHDLQTFHDRFYNFEDGVVRAITLDFWEAEETCQIEIECKDRSSTEGWSTVHFMVKKVSEFRFERRKTEFIVLSGGIQFAWRKEQVYLVLDAYPDDEGDLPNLKENCAYAVGMFCEWNVNERPAT